MTATEKIALKPTVFVKTKKIRKEVRDRSSVLEIILRERKTFKITVTLWTSEKA